MVARLTQLSDCNITSVSSGCELFLRFITLKVSYAPAHTHSSAQAAHVEDFAKFTQQLVESGAHP